MSVREYSDVIEKLGLKYVDKDDIEELEYDYEFFESNDSERYPDISITSIKSLASEISYPVLYHIHSDAKELNMTPECLTALILMLLNPKLDCISIKNTKDNLWFYLVWSASDSIDYEKLKELSKEEPNLFVRKPSNVDLINGQPINIITNKDIRDL